jgi:protein-tyrosine phosphatase
MAEELFNHYARQADLEFEAISKGLASKLNSIGNVGPIAPLAVSILETGGFPVRSRERWPQTVTDCDFQTAHTVIALNLPEHQPMVQAQYPQFAERVSYWNVPDIGEMPVDEALKLLQSQIQALITTLRTEQSTGVSN